MSTSDPRATHVPTAAAQATFRSRMRQRIGQILVDSTYRGLSRIGQLHPDARPERHGVEILRDVPYRSPAASGGAWHLCDIYRPRPEPFAERVYQTPYPLVLYIHGGGFRILSKDSHWVMALALARRGMVVVNVNYRLAPQHPFPAALSDVCAALEHAIQAAPGLGADPRRLVVTGESAGANLALALTLLCCYRRPEHLDEPWARRVFELGVVPRVTLPMCGVLQVSDPDRFRRRKPLRPFIYDRLAEVTAAYLDSAVGVAPETRQLADPLVLLERGAPPDRPLPPMFAGVGTADPLLDDTRRLGAALARLGVPHEVRYYPRELHAFHALAFRDQARACWRHQYDFLDRYLSDADPTVPPSRGS